MKEKKIFDAVTNVPDDLIEEARKTKLKKSFNHRKQWMIATAACFVLVIGAAFVFQQSGNNLGGENIDAPNESNDTITDMHISDDGADMDFSYKPNDTIADMSGINSQASIEEVVFPRSYAYENDKRRKIISNNPVTDPFLAALNNFSYKTAAQIFTKSSDNLNYSPLSLYYALAMLTSGAEGETAKELLSLLGVSDRKTLSEQCGNLYRQLYFDNEIGKLKIGNSLWMDNSIVWKDEYIKNAARNFYAHSFNVDFADEQTAKIMSKWVYDMTNSTLKPKMEINPQQILSIINTIYFYDEWSDKFNKLKTVEDKFYLKDSTTVKSDFMNTTNLSASFSKGDGFTRSQLGLKNVGEMVFILPDEGVSPRELLSSPKKIKDIFENGKKGTGEVVWKIPKFNFKSSFDLRSILEDLGVKSAFDDADFSGITDNAAFISDVHQETYISIDENGVEASAFTEIILKGTGMSPDKIEKVEMILNRPFIYGITASDGTLLFVGICENPNAE